MGDLPHALPGLLGLAAIAGIIYLALRPRSSDDADGYWHYEEEEYREEWWED